MKLVMTSIACVVAVVGPALAQTPYPVQPTPYPAPGYQQRPAIAYADPNGWRAVSPTARDAYRDGLINRWQYEQIEGPTPQALQGPSPDGSRGGDGGGGGFSN